jgi:hypothetical protein
MALQRAMSRPGPLIASLDERQRESGRNAALRWRRRLLNWFVRND